MIAHVVCTSRFQFALHTRSNVCYLHRHRLIIEKYCNVLKLFFILYSNENKQSIGKNNDIEKQKTFLNLKVD
jgi:hypothetical protein